MCHKVQLKKRTIFLALLLIGLVSAFAMDIDCLIDGCHHGDTMSICHTERNLITEGAWQDLTFLQACAFITGQLSAISISADFAYPIHDGDSPCRIAFRCSPSLRAPPL
jgi:hypothetical protein